MTARSLVSLLAEMDGEIARVEAVHAENAELRVRVGELEAEVRELNAARLGDSLELKNLRLQIAGQS